MPNSSDKSIKINPEKVPLETDQGILESEERKWGIPLREVYKHGLAFYKDKDGKAVHLSYEDRLKLVAYTQQAVHGPLDIINAQPLGVLDVIGRDRRAAWQALGNISQIQAMVGFIHTLDRLCPLFKPYIEAIQKDQENKKQQENKKNAEERSHKELHERIILEKENQKSNILTEEQQVQRIKDALNAQTYDQFLQYAQQQYPGNCDQQAILIRQLQDQHYQQYIQQLAVDQRLVHSKLNDCLDDKDTKHNVEDHNVTEKDCNLNETVLEDNNKSMQTSDKTDDNMDLNVDDSKEEDSDDDGFPPIEEARMWTRTEMVQFKELAKSNGGCLTVGQGETVTLRVPTNAKAKNIIWSFATDYYDIGFGVYFEWSKSTSSEVTIHVSESDDDDGDDDEVDDEYVQQTDLEFGPDVRENSALNVSKPPVSIVIPIYRRDSHKDVYAGSHTYPADGVYLLKFDNTYSLWRSKTLYYEIFYSH